MSLNVKHKIEVTVEGQTYLVEIEDTNAPELKVVVNGQSYQIKIREIEALTAPLEGLSLSSAPVTKAASILPDTAVGTPKVVESGDLTAPLPGNIVEIMVGIGDQVTAGQPMCVIEAMKMKNVLRSPRAGKIAAIEVSLGETVPYNKTLIRFV